MRSSKQWTFLLGLVIGLVLIVVHLVTWHHSDQLLAKMLADKAALFLDALAVSAEQTLQASHFLEERVVSRLKVIAKEIILTQENARTKQFLETLQRQNDLRTIEICDSNGTIIQSNDVKVIGSRLPHSFECQEILHGTKIEHAFGFSQGIFCEADAFGYACRLPEGGLVRLITGVEFILGFEQNVGLPSLLEKLKKHPGVKALNLVDLSGKSILKAASNISYDPQAYSASFPLVLHGQPIGRFELTISELEISALRQTSALAIAFSGVLSCMVLVLLLWRFQRYRDHQDQLRVLLDSRRRIEGLGKVVAAVAHDVFEKIFQPVARIQKSWNE
ncbi:hypothetical protein HYY75_00340 [bacterium]|nr:hypothetical protein [bacterium]